MVGKTARLIVFSDPNANPAMSTTSKFYIKHKGKAGRYNPYTIRGGLGFYDTHLTRMNMTEEQRLALDPLMIYPPNRSFHPDPNEAGLIKNLTTIHSPEDHEREKDFGAILTEDELVFLLS